MIHFSHRSPPSRRAKLSITRTFSLLLLLLLHAPHWAHADQSAAFVAYIDGARQAGLPVGYLQQAALHLTEVEFTDVPGAVATYSSMFGIWTKIQFDRSLEGQPGQLKVFEELGTNDHATIFHELWHCYLDTVERMGNTPFYQQIVARAATLYQTQPTDKRIEIFDEAAAGLIEGTISTFLILSPSARKKGPWERETWRQAPSLLNLWDNHFNQDKYCGYYFTFSGEVYCNVPLERADIDLILGQVTEGLFTDDFAFTFSDDHLFPDNGAPVPHCANITARPGTTITLDASQSADPEGLPLEFRWEQTAGAPLFADGAMQSEITREALLSLTPPALGLYSLLLTIADPVRLCSQPLEVEVLITEEMLDAEAPMILDAGSHQPSPDFSIVSVIDTSPDQDFADTPSSSGCMIGRAFDDHSAAPLWLLGIALILKRGRQRARS